MKTQKTQNSQSSSKQKEQDSRHHNIQFQMILQSTVRKTSMKQTYRSTEQNRRHRNTHTQPQPSDSGQRNKTHVGEKTTFLTNAAEKTGYRFESRSLCLILYKSQFKMDQRPEYKS